MTFGAGDGAFPDGDAADRGDARRLMVEWGHHDHLALSVAAQFWLEDSANRSRRLAVAARGTTQEAVRTALRLGYGHIDTARIYGNERDVGEAVKTSGVPRADVFVTTKLWNDDQGYDSALRAFDSSLERLGLDYVDLYLIHWPVAEKRADSWRAMEKIFADKRARAIGVSNYLVPHLEELLAKANVPPAVNQIEVHPFLQHRDTRAYCAKHGIVVEAYGPLTHAKRIAIRSLPVWRSGRSDRTRRCSFAGEFRGGWSSCRNRSTPASIVGKREKSSTSSSTLTAR